MIDKCNKKDNEMNDTNTPALSQGMTLRDYFAAHAPETPDMQNFPIKQWAVTEIVDLGQGMKGPRQVLNQESWAKRAARWSAEYADAMIAERATPSPAVQAGTAQGETK